MTVVSSMDDVLITPYSPMMATAEDRKSYVLTQVGKHALLRQIGHYPFAGGVPEPNVTTGSPVLLVRALQWPE
jgi:hypothetical protein